MWLWIILIIVIIVPTVLIWQRMQPPTGMTQFQDKVVLITGASSGIGQATARQFAAQGAKLVLVARRSKILDEMQAELGDEATILTVSADLTKPEDIERILTTTERQFGRLDVLVNNAGIVDTEPLENIDAERIQQIITVNLIGPIHLTRLALPLLRSQEQAHIVNVSSTVGLTRVPRQATYGASKAGLNGFTDAMRRELHATGIHVSMVLPGLVNTPMLGDFSNRDEALDMLKSTGMDIPGVYLNEADEIATEIIDAIRYNKREVLLGGWMFVLLSLMGRHTPGLLDSVFVQMFKTENLQEQVAGKE